MKTRRAQGSAGFSTRIWEISILLMKPSRITEHIEYVRPENEIGRFPCSEMIVHGSGTVFFDTNFGEATTKELLLSERPDFALLSHYHLDHALWSGFVRSASDAVMFDLHGGVLNEGGLDSFFPGMGRKSQFRSRKS
jgi:glyoxylase-like metal-dependent hydrolase (beta-lactamase superfamily II)